MLIKINPILSPELLFVLRSMGHGDKLTLADANFPADTMNKKVIRLDGVSIPEAAKAILSVFPLDSFLVSQGKVAVSRMEVDGKPQELLELHKEFINIVKEISDADCEKIIKIYSLTDDAKKQAIALIKSVYNMFLGTDANMVEVNPLILTKEKNIICLDAKVNFDSNALFRHPEIDRKSTRLNSSHSQQSRMPSST